MPSNSTGAANTNYICVPLHSSATTAKRQINHPTKQVPSLRHQSKQDASDFVTVVEVQEKETRNSLNSDEFVTVLQVGEDVHIKRSTHKNIMEDVEVYRLPGERLGMALKFEGGTSASEKIDRVYIQNINPDSPASRATGKTLGGLFEGDEILQIEGNPVSAMTRIVCVQTLRDAPVCITVTIKREVQSVPHTSAVARTDKSVLKNGLPSPNGRQMSSFKGPTTANVSKKGPPPPTPPRLASTTLSRSSGRKAIADDSTSSNLAHKEQNGSSDHGRGLDIHLHQEKGVALASLNSTTNKRRPPPLPPRRPKEPPPAVPVVAQKGAQFEYLTKTTKLRSANIGNGNANDLGMVKRPPISFTESGGSGSLSHRHRHDEERDLIPEPQVYVDLFAEKEGGVSFCLFNLPFFTLRMCACVLLNDRPYRIDSTN